MLIQQGDVLIRQIAEIPPNAKKMNRTPRGYVLAEGEVTGHAHCIVSDVDMFIDNDLKYLHNTEAVTLTHEEHNHVQIPEGIWEIGIVKEYDHFAEEAKNVKD